MTEKQVERKKSAEVRLKRFIYTNSEDMRFISGDPEVHNKFTMKQITFKDDMTVEELRRVPILLESLSKENVPYKDGIFFALAALMRPSPDKVNSNIHELYTAALNLFESNEDMFSFVKFYRRQVKNVPSGLKKIVGSYYFQKEPMELLRAVTESNSYHGWSHKDLFKLIHYKTDNILFDLIIKYVLYGFDKTLAIAGNTKEEKDIVDYLKDLKKFKTTQDEQLAVSLLGKLSIDHVRQVPIGLIKSPVVWEALIPRLSICELLNHLPKLYKMGFLKQGPLHDKVVEILLDRSKITQSKIQPIEVFIGLKNLEKGGKPKDPNLIKYLQLKQEENHDPNVKKLSIHQEPAKCPQILAALQKTLQSSFVNLRPISKRVMITVEINDKMTEPALTTRNVTRIEAAAMIVLSMIKTNRIYTVAVFNGNGISVVQLDKGASIGQIIKKLKEANYCQVNYHTPLDWAKKNKKTFDLFINIFTGSSFAVTFDQAARLRAAYDNYCKEVNQNEVRFINYHAAIHNLAYASSESKPFLDVCGFDSNTMKVIDAFAKNLF